MLHPKVSTKLETGAGAFRDMIQGQLLVSVVAHVNEAQDNKQVITHGSEFWWK
jgi:hypothetical protein